jgi:hypothetical protein
VYTVLRIFFAAFPVIAGAYVLYSALEDLSRSRAASTWPEVSANVLRNERGGYLTGGLFEYAYQVNGVPYKSVRYSFGPSTLGEHGDLVQGATVTARYDPADPAQAVIRTGPSLGHALQAAVGVGLVLVAGMVWRRTA